MEKNMLQVSPECEIHSSRLIKASREEVFHAAANPDLLKQWWGPKGFTNTFKEFDLRPGGRWKFTMHGPEAGHFENECMFLRIERPELIAWQRLSKPLFRMVLTFDEAADGNTLIGFRMQFDNAEDCEKLRKHVPDKNEENFDRLEALLESISER